jgi:hypothetical protein
MSSCGLRIAGCGICAAVVVVRACLPNFVLPRMRSKCFCSRIRAEMLIFKNEASLELLADWHSLAGILRTLCEPNEGDTPLSAHPQISTMHFASIQHKVVCSSKKTAKCTRLLDTQRRHCTSTFHCKLCGATNIHIMHKRPQERIARS